MKLLSFQLNPEKSPFCNIGEFMFSEEMQKKEIDLEDLSIIHLQQFLYNVNCGVLLVEDYKKLLQFVKIMTMDLPKNDTQKEIQPSSPQISFSKEDLKEMRSLLKKRVPTVEKESSSFSIRKLKKLLELEQEGKNRKKVVSFLDKKIEMHQNQIQEKINSSSTENTKEFRQKFPKESVLVSDVEESEQEELVFTQEVLEKIKESEQEQIKIKEV